ncbi:aminopeptidase P family N-terminal domain-containing protein [Neorhizobium sp. Rsf11]|uniref:Aminopeptidase P family N-terminal domain-containing protein n=1 Tax=Neorhizobium phenanthreniclasticum TaxID=3157917 RepID=A0ABV0M776_9HYPH
MSDLDRNRAEALMQAAGMDGLAIFQPEAFRYATELDAGVAAMWRRAGACIALVPADKRLRTGAVAADHAVQFLDLSTRNVDVLRQRIWIDYLVLPPALGEDPFPELARQYAAQGLGGARPESFDRAEAFRLLGELLDTRGLLSATIGCDLEFVPAADFAALQEALPNVRFIDGSDVLRRLRRCSRSLAGAGCRTIAAAISAIRSAQAAAAKNGPSFPPAIGSLSCPA